MPLQHGRGIHEHVHVGDVAGEQRLPGLGPAGRPVDVQLLHPGVGSQLVDDRTGVGRAVLEQHDHEVVRSVQEQRLDAGPHVARPTVDQQRDRAPTSTAVRRQLPHGGDDVVRRTGAELLPLGGVPDRPAQRRELVAKPVVGRLINPADSKVRGVSPRFR